MKTPKKILVILLAVLLTVMTIIIPALPAFAATVTLYISPTSGPLNTVINISGTGFTTPANYWVLFNSAQVTAATPISVGGTIAISIPIPYVLPRGNYPVTVATDAAPADTISVPTFAITPQISINTTSGLIGDHLTVSGNGFSASSSVTIYFDNVAMTTATTDVSGQLLNTVITIPSTYGGNHSVTAADAFGPSPALTYSINPSMTLGNTTGAVGGSIAVSGEGFAASSQMSFFIDSNTANVSAVTDSYGRFTNVAIPIPPISAGTHVLKVQDAASHILTSNISVTAIMTIGPTSGPIDTSVAISGSGFLASTPITITYDSAGVTTIPASTSSDASGSFNATFKIPASSSGSHVVKASDGTNSLTANFTSSSTASINTTSGPVGTAVTASGNGFKGNGTITIIYNGIQAGTTTTDAKGNFNTTFNVIPASTGAHALVLTDQVNIQNFSFSVTPTSTIDSTGGVIGSSINVSGLGFGATQSVTVKYDNDQIATSSTDANGTFTVAFKAPVSKGGNHVITVSAGTVTKTYDYAIDATPPPVPVLSLPANMTRGDKVPTLSWEDVTDTNGGITYTLQVSKDITFSSILLEKDGLTTSTYTFAQSEILKPASKKAPYYWRVKATDAASNVSAWSTPSNFFVGFVMPAAGYYAIAGVVAVGLAVGGFLLGSWFGRRRA